MSENGEVSTQSSDVPNGGAEEVTAADDDENSVIEEEDLDDEDDDEHGSEDDDDEDEKIVPSSQERSIVEYGDEDGYDDDSEDDFVGAQSQVPRPFFQRIFSSETDVRFVNDTDREVLFVIADEEFTVKRTTKVSAEASINDDDDDGNMMNMNFGLNLIPLSAGAKMSQSTTVSHRALRTRCMPVAPRSHSTQHFRQERLTYVTALSKDEDGEGNPWTRVHYENKVINCQRTKSLKFCRKHLKVSAYRIVAGRPPPPLLKQAGTRRLISNGGSLRTITADGERNGSKRSLSSPRSLRRSGSSKRRRFDSPSG